VTYALCTAVHPERYPWSGAGNINFDLMPDLLIKAFTISRKSKLHE
jgi:hypothetical protein